VCVYTGINKYWLISRVRQKFCLPYISSARELSSTVVVGKQLTTTDSSYHLTRVETVEMKQRDGSFTVTNKNNRRIVFLLLGNFLISELHKAVIEKLIVIHLDKKFPAFYGTRSFITVFARTMFGLHREPEETGSLLNILF
jgi:hypothetical protein